MEKKIEAKETRGWIVSAILFAVSCVFWMLTLYEAAQDGFPSISTMSWWETLTFLWANTTWFKFWIGTAAIAAIIHYPTAACFTLFIGMPVCMFPPTLVVVPGMSPYEALDLSYFSGLVWGHLFFFSIGLSISWIFFDMFKEYVNEKKKVSLA